MHVMKLSEIQTKNCSGYNLTNDQLKEITDISMNIEQIAKMLRFQEEILDRIKQLETRMDSLSSLVIKGINTRERYVQSKDAKTCCIYTKT